ncbi:MAG: hypothetical protein IRY99_18040, partial [Isosphaeraceae bacterium]|nr:hypothetical protein [Isosphaeraceae bacterium]
MTAMLAEAACSAPAPQTDSPPTLDSLVEAAARRGAAWKEVLRPRNAIEDWLIGYAALAAVRLDHLVRVAEALRAAEAVRARGLWEEQRALAAEELGARLAKDPARVAKRLRQTKQGCDWMIQRWEGLVRSLEGKGRWEEPQLSLAFDLLGVPHDRRGSDPRLAHDAAAWKAVARGEIAALEDLKARGLDEQDRVERAEAVAGRSLGETAAARLLRRELAARERTVRWALEQ